MSQHIDVSYTSILRVLVVLAVLTFLYFIRDVVALVFVSLFLSAAITPWVNWFHKKSIPRGMAVIIIYLAAFTVISLVVVLIIPPLTEQISMIASSFPDYFQKVIVGFSELQQFNNAGTTETLQDSLSSLQSTLTTATQGIFNAVASIFGGIIFFIAVLVLTFYMVINEEMFLKFIHQFSPPKYKKYAVDFIKRVQIRLGKWLRGQLLLMFFIFLLTFTGLSILRVEFALALALMAGLMELIPYAGPILSAVPAIFLALGQSPLLAVAVVILYFLIQQVENNFLVPKVMQRAVGLNPIITILAILIGAKIGGIMGAVIAVPVATVTSMLISDWQEHRTRKTSTV